MEVFHKLSQVSEKISRSALAIGNFDGIHLGHQALLRACVEDARRKKIPAVLLTFFPHPVEVLNPTKPLQRLTTTAEKLALLEELGLDFVLVEPFTPELAALSPSDFFNRYVIRGLGAQSLRVGFNFRFGHKRAGGISELENFCAQNRVELSVQPAFSVDGVKVSSSFIRGLLLEGKVKEATKLLGRPYFIQGKVVHGDGRGRNLGASTANLSFSHDKLLPKHGVYIVRAKWQRQNYRGVTNIGVRPTFGEDKLPGIEVHLLDFSSGLYDEAIEVCFLDRIRDEQKFESPEALKAQIARDIATAKNYQEDGA